MVSSYSCSEEQSYEPEKITSLTLMYDDKTEKFGFKFATKMSYGYILQSDKTSEYQQRYPDAGITEVKESCLEGQWDNPIRRTYILIKLKKEVINKRRLPFHRLSWNLYPSPSIRLLGSLNLLN